MIDIRDRLPERWFTVLELAAYLGVSRAWVFAQLKLGMPSRNFGNHRRFKVSDVEAWFADREGDAG